MPRLCLDLGKQRMRRVKKFLKKKQQRKIIEKKIPNACVAKSDGSSKVKIVAISPPHSGEENEPQGSLLS